MLKHRKNHLPTILSVVATVAVLVFTLIWFEHSINGKVAAVNELYLVGNTRALATVFATKLDDQLVMLESQVRYFEGVDVSDYNAMKNTVMSMRGIGAFNTIGVANAEGATINYNGKSSGNLLLKDFFQTALNGETAVSNHILTDEEGHDVLMVGLPITQKGVSVGVLFGTFAHDELSELLNVSDSTNSGSSILVNGNGDVLAVSENAAASLRRVTNLFADTTVAKPVSGNSTVNECSIGESDCIVTVTPIGVHGWYFASVLPRTVISEQTAAVSYDVLLLVLAISFAFVLSFISILYLIKNNEDIRLKNERFKLVTVETQDLIFDYNFQKQTLTLDGSTDSVISSPKSEFTRAETLGFINLIHEEDKEIRSRLLDLRNGTETTIKGEFRIKCIDGTYSWFRMKGNIARAHDGTPQRMIGSLINADEQMNREQRLISRSEVDPLTGIFSKSAFYTRVNDKLKGASDSDLFAIYIIDIDNFKAINDEFGHSMGDEILADIGKKLCIVFSDMDYVGRVGGDEFAAFLHLSSKARNVGMNIIESKAKAICSQISDTYSSKKKQISVTASVGAAIYPYSGRDYNTLFRNADKALKKVKESGKNSYSIYSSKEYENEQ